MGVVGEAIAQALPGKVVNTHGLRELEIFQPLPLPGIDCETLDRAREYMVVRVQEFNGKLSRTGVGRFVRNGYPRGFVRVSEGGRCGLRRVRSLEGLQHRQTEDAAERRERQEAGFHDVSPR